MHYHLIETFEAIAETLLPTLIDFQSRAWLQEDEIKISAAYRLRNPLTLSKVMAELERFPKVFRRLYYSARSRYTDYGRSVCYYRVPDAESMYQINAQTEPDGFVHEVYVTHFISIDDMRFNLVNEARRIRALRSDVFEFIEDKTFIMDFLF